MPKPALKTETKQAKKTETAVSIANEAAGADMVSIISLLEEHRASSELAQREHRASISADFKAAFAVLEAKLNQTQTTVAEYGEQIDSLETNANLPAPLFPARLQITLGSGAKKRFPSPLEAVAFAAGYEREPAN
ncbi:hypothetical protein JOQ06_013062 [Pogonophryne albipinna]|uniref:Uncharacterized protein n=1 Tax=Pogonophryne albipinna TaxID=1090488 RepID=A0AAD6BIX6_9TELE|nr:hypothetical protein JOQ06_013062 [Pogonophryne albipinna]